MDMNTTTDTTTSTIQDRIEEVVTRNHIIGSAMNELALLNDEPWAVEMVATLNEKLQSGLQDRDRLRADYRRAVAG